MSEENAEMKSQTPQRPGTGRRAVNTKKPAYGMALGLSVTLLVVFLGTAGGREPEKAGEALVITLEQELAVDARDVPDPDVSAPQFSFVMAGDVKGGEGSAKVYQITSATKKEVADFAKKIGETGELREDGFGGYGIGRLYLHKSGVFSWVDGEAYSTKKLICKPKSGAGPTTTAPEGLPCVPDEESSGYDLPDLEEAQRMALSVLRDAKLDKAQKDGPYWRLDYLYQSNGVTVRDFTRAEVATTGLSSVTGVFTSLKNMGEYDYVSASDALEDLTLGLMVASYIASPGEESGVVEIDSAELVYNVLWGEGTVAWCVPTWRFTSKNGGVFSAYALKKEYLRKPDVVGSSTSTTDGEK